MSSLTIIGGSAKTRDLWREYHADRQWTMPHVHMQGVPAHLLFEMHTPADLQEIPGGRKRWEYLRGDPAPVYMLEAHPELPGSQRYPLEWVRQEIFGGLYVGDEPRDFFGSTFDYMLGLAIASGYRRINVVGFDMEPTTEYFYQRPTAHFFLGAAVGRGIEVVLPETTGLVLLKRYGYESYPRLVGQALERIEMVTERMSW